MPLRCGASEIVGRRRAIASRRGGGGRRLFARSRARFAATAARSLRWCAPSCNVWRKRRAVAASDARWLQAMRRGPLEMRDAARGCLSAIGSTCARTARISQVGAPSLARCVQEILARRGGPVPRSSRARTRCAWSFRASRGRRPRIAAWVFVSDDISLGVGLVDEACRRGTPLMSGAIASHEGFRALGEQPRQLICVNRIKRVSRRVASLSDRRAHQAATAQRNLKQKCTASSFCSRPRSAAPSTHRAPRPPLPLRLTARPSTTSPRTRRSRSRCGE